MEGLTGLFYSNAMNGVPTAALIKSATGAI
jgi:hypothetical protein